MIERGGHAVRVGPRSYERVVERAGSQHGFITVDDLAELGVSQAYLRRLAARGAAEHRARGVYRLRALPVTPRDEFHEAALWAGPGSAVAGEAALALWELADVNPRRIEVAVPPGRRVRRVAGGDRFVVVGQVQPDDIDFVDDIPVVGAATAIAQAVARGVDGTLVAQAIDNAARRKLIDRVTEARLVVAAADRADGWGTR